MNHEYIYEKIFARLEELHMSQIELSRRTGIATSTISDWRKKKINPQADKLVAICRALDMSLVDLLCDEEEADQATQTDYMHDEKYVIDVFRNSDLETKRRLLRYFELVEICKEINQKNESTIVFPFEMDIANDELCMIIENRFRDFKSFEIEMQGFSKCEDRLGNYLFLNMIKGAETIIQLHDLLYSNEFSAFDLGMPFIPHMTVGKLKTVDDLNDACESVAGNKTVFKSIITKISVEMIGENDESIIVIEKKLC